jgi:hypothetical protein
MVHDPSFVSYRFPRFPAVPGTGHRFAVPAVPALIGAEPEPEPIRLLISDACGSRKYGRPQPQQRLNRDSECKRALHRCLRLLFWWGFASDMRRTARCK